MQSTIDLLRIASLMLDRVLTAVESLEDVSASLAQCNLPAFIKSFDDRILFTNQPYNDVFSNGATPVGRRNYLHNPIARISHLSDELIIEGTTHVLLSKTWIPETGDGVNRLDLAKLSLVGCGHPTIAILGVCRLHSTSPQGFRRQSKYDLLTERWRRLQKLSEFDRSCANLLARHEKCKDVARLLDVSPRTVEVHRKRILDQLGLNNVLELTNTLCRIQDAGLADFGL